MTNELTTSVLIIGAGPVGLTLAMDLAWRGIAVVVVEERPAGEPPSVKCNHISSRSMEIFRRLGIAAALRDDGLPADYPADFAVRTRATGYELTRIPIPARQDRYTATGGGDTDWPTPEPPHRINQTYFEPTLARTAEAMAGVTILHRTRFETFVQAEDGVRATVVDMADGRSLAIACDYLVGCDGGRSTVRRGIGATLSGDAVIQRVQSTYFRSAALLDLITPPPAWMCYLFNPLRAGNLVAIDGKEHWLLHNYLRPGEGDFDEVDRDRCLRLLLGVDNSFEYELLAKEDWIGRRLVADKLRDRRVFICGDASHLWVPLGGYGMNAGIADAMNLSWMLAACMQGWAPPELLDAHQLERLPITEQVSFFAMDQAYKVIKERTSLPAELEDATPAGALAREQVGRSAYDTNIGQVCCGGLNYGYYYDKSPIIAYDGESAPAYTMGDFTPSTVPGCRTPHFWLADGRSLYDAMGPYYTLLCFDAALDLSALTKAAADRGLPLEILHLAAFEQPAPYRHALVLSRPDQHVAWRSDTVPSDPVALIDLIRGAAVAPVAALG